MGFLRKRLEGRLFFQERLIENTGLAKPDKFRNIPEETT
jgi:hypothetical protein